LLILIEGDNQMKYLFFLFFMSTAAVHAATVIIYNKSDKPVTVGLWYSDREAVATTAAATYDTLTFLTSDIEHWHPLSSKDFGGAIVKYKKEVINPGKLTYIDSGLNDIHAIDFLPYGATEKITFNPDISWWRTFAKVEYRGPNDIKRV